jgi:glycosyltransferase involved in cell wall biosynthesis
MNAVRVSKSPSAVRVCLDARLVSGQFGGVEQVIIGLADGLSRLTDSPDEYLFLVDWDHKNWLKPYVGGPCRLLIADRSITGGRGGFLGKQGRRVPWYLGRRPASPTPGRPPDLPSEDRAVQRARVDLMHFTMQVGSRTSIPSIYQPHDLLHRHLPQLLSPETLAAREVAYRTLCDQAVMVVAMSRWGKRDLIEQYALPEDKIQIIPWAPVIEAYRQPSPQDLAQTRARLGLPEAFALYPAKAWPHKNHLRLLEAMRILREQHGLVIPVVFTGAQDGLEIPLCEEAARLGIAEQVLFTGFVDPVQLRSLYRLARLLVFPSLFEGWGMPILEAFAAELPVTSSNVTCLPDLTAGAALLFDPSDPAAIAAAIGDLWTDESKRDELARRGSARAAMFSWEHTARIFRAHYRRLANRGLTEEDLELLGAEALV